MMEGSGGAGVGGRPEWRWDVALSFAGAQRDHVEQVAQAQSSNIHMRVSSTL
jgi:hypothetical protein